MQQTATNLTDAFDGFLNGKRYMLIDRDAKFCPAFHTMLNDAGVEPILLPPKSPDLNPYAERVIGFIRRECLDKVIILNEGHLRRLVSEYFRYYHDDRCHLSLDRNAPNQRAVEPRGSGRVVSVPRVGGLHHRYRRVA